MTGPVTARQAETLRKQLAFLTRDGDRYRAVITDSESLDGIALVCTSPQHVEYDSRTEASAPPPEDGTGVSVYDCCLEEFRPIETNSETFAAFIVAAMDAVPALLDERDALLARVAELEAVDPETAADIKAADALARYKAAHCCPDCGNPKSSLAHGARCLSTLKERDV